MSKKILYTGESKYRTFIIKDAEGTPIDHANILDIEVVLSIDGSPVWKGKKVATTGYITLEEETDPGTYSFKLLESETLLFPPSKEGLQMEVFRKYDSTDLPTEKLKSIMQLTLYDEVSDSQYRKQH